MCTGATKTVQGTYFLLDTHIQIHVFGQQTTVTCAPRHLNVKHVLSDVQSRTLRDFKGRGPRAVESEHSEDATRGTREMLFVQDSLIV